MEALSHAFGSGWRRLTSTRHGHTVIMLLIIPLYAICFVAIRLGLAYAPPLRFAALRLLVAGAALLMLAAATHQPLVIPRRSWPGLLALAGAAGTIGYGAMFLSPGWADASIASVLGNTQPLMLVVLGATILGERITRQQVVALVLGLVGVTFVSFSAFTELRLAGLVGALLAFASAASFAVASVLMKRLGPSIPLLAMTAWQFLLGALPLFAFSAWFERSAVIRWAPPFVGILLLLGLGGTALTTAVWYWLIQHDDVGRLSLLLFLVPIVGVFLAVVLLSESLTLSIVVGIALTVLGVFSALSHDAQRAPVVVTSGHAASGASSRPASGRAHSPSPIPGQKTPIPTPANSRDDSPPSGSPAR